MLSTKGMTFLFSTPQLVHSEFLRLKGILKKNGYPLSIIDSCISRFLNNIFRIKPDGPPTVRGKPLFLILPFCGANVSTMVRNRV